MAGLKSWLRKSPQPSYLIVITEDDEEKKIKLSEDSRNRWKAAEEAVLVSRAVSVQAMNEKGEIIRATAVQSEDGEVSEVDEEARESRKDAKEISKERRELAALLDRYGHRLNEAFEKGADSTARSQDQLVALVETLTSHLSQAITNLHTISVQYAQALQGEQPQSSSDTMMQQLLGVAVSRGLGGGAPAAPSNGKKDG